MKILIIEDTKSLARTLADIIQESGGAADIVLDGISGLEYARTGIYDGIVLDVMLPGMDGFAILDQIRKEKINTPVLMLTAKGEVKDRVHGLNIGADYYLTKPFEIAEFSACLKAILRRQDPSVHDGILQFGDLMLSPASHEVSCGEKSIRLNSKEYELLRLLILNKKNIVPKETILSKIWGYDSEATDNNLEAYISFLRKKLHLLSSQVAICIVRKVGYYLDEK